MQITCQFQLLRIIKHYEKYMYHLLTVNVRIRTEINIPLINFL
jgi:hypothetical protein